jgi:sugar/nucleoside kinase (ribokinase family)
MNDAEYDACKTTGVSDLHQYGPTLVIVTSDKHGGMFSKSDSKPERFEACTDYLSSLSTKVHTVGAGDWFHAAFIVRCIELGKSICSLTIEEIHDCIKFAARVSGKKVTMQGAANGPSQSDL